MDITRNRKTAWLAAAALMGLTPIAAFSQELPPASLPPSIRVSGESIVTAKPDRVQVDVGVMTQASQSQAAATQNAQQLETVLAALRKALGANADIRTISYSLQPNYHYSRDGGPPNITGYTALNVVRVTLDDISRIGRVIDTAAQSGANQVQRVQFMLKDEQSVRAQALKDAAVKARAQADALAAALGVKVVRVLSASESTPIVFPMQDMVMAREAAASPTPIQPGSIEMRATVTLTVEIVER
jgi:uncharacterized protein